MSELLIKLKTLYDKTGAAAAAKDMAGLSGAANAAGNQTAASFGKARAGVESISRSLAGARTAFVAFQSAQAVGGALSGITAMVDSYTAFNARLRLATASALEFAQAQDTVNRLAAAAQADTASLATLYGRLAGAVRNLGGTQSDTARITEAVALSLRISGASAQESASAILQFSQAVSSGVLRGEEFNAVNESAPRLLQALADAMGRPKEELRALAENGQLTTAEIGKLSSQLDVLRGEAERIPATIGGSFQVLKNSLQQAIGRLDEATGLSRALSSAILFLSENLAASAIAVGALSAAFVALAAKAAGAVGLGAVAASLGGIVALLTGPVGISVALIAAGVAFFNFANKAERDLQRVIDKERELQKREAQDAASKPGPARTSQLVKDLAERNRQIEAKQAELARLARKGRGLSGAVFGSSAAERIGLQNDIKTLQDSKARLEREIAAASKPTVLTAPVTRSGALDGLVLKSVELQKIAKQRETINRFFDAELAKSNKAQDGREAALLAERAEALAVLDEKRAALNKPKPVPSRTQAESAEQAALREAERLAAARLALDETLAAQADRIAASATQTDLDRTEAAYRAKKISAEDYYATLVRLQEDAALIEIAALERQRDAAAKSAVRAQGKGDRAGVLDASGEVARLNTEIALAQAKVNALRTQAATDLAEAQAERAKEDVEKIAARFDAEEARLASLRQRLDSEVQVGMKTQAAAAAELRRESADTGRVLAAELVPQLQALAAATNDPAIAEGYRRQIAGIQALVAQGGARGPFDGAIQGLREYFGETADLFETIRAGVGQAFKGMEDALVGFVTTGKLNFKSLANSILADLARIAIQNAITRPLAGALESALGSFAGSFSGGFVPLAKGGVPPSGVSAWRNQVVSQPTFFRFAQGGVFGEAGPEAVMPLRRGAGGRLGVDASGMGGGHTTVVVNNYSNATATTRERSDTQGNRMVEVMIEQAESRIAGNIARGAGPVTQAISGTFGLNRAAGAY